MQPITYTMIFTLQRPLNFELSSESIPFVMDEDYLYGFLPAEQFMEWCREYAKAPDMQELIKQYGLDEQANPILMKCKLK